MKWKRAVFILLDEVSFSLPFSSMSRLYTVTVSLPGSAGPCGFLHLPLHKVLVSLSSLSNAMLFLCGLCTLANVGLAFSEQTHIIVKDVALV